MKKTRKFAALLAAVMCVSAMGAMNAFAEGEVNVTVIDSSTGTNSNKYDTEKTSNIDLSATLTQNITKSYQADPMWSISITSDSALTWNVTRTATALYTLTWNPSTHVYETPTLTGNVNANNDMSGAAPKSLFKIF